MDATRLRYLRQTPARRSSPDLCFPLSTDWANRKARLDTEPGDGAGRWRSLYLYLDLRRHPRFLAHKGRDTTGIATEQSCLAALAQVPVPASGRACAHLSRGGPALALHAQIKLPTTLEAH